MANRQRSTSSASLIRFISDTVSIFSQDERRPTGATTAPVVVVNDPRARNYPNNEDDDDEQEIPLPNVDHFCWDAIIDHVKPHYDRVIDASRNITSQYRQDLTSEIQHVVETQNQLTSHMEKIDTLAGNTVKDTHSRLNKASSQLRSIDRSGVELLSSMTEQSYDLISSITGMLHEIDMLLPKDERLNTPESPHRLHFPRLYKLLQSTSHNYHHQGEQHKNANERVEFPHTEATKESSSPNPNSLHYQKPRRAVSLSALSSYTASTSSGSNTISRRRHHNPSQRSISTRPESLLLINSTTQTIDEYYPPRSLLTLTAASPAIAPATEDMDLSPLSPTGTITFGSEHSLSSASHETAKHKLQKLMDNRDHLDSRGSKKR